MAVASNVPQAIPEPPSKRTKRLAPPTLEDVSGICKCGAPIDIGISNSTPRPADQGVGPDMSMWFATTADGALALWEDGKGISGRALDTSGQPVGEALGFLDIKTFNLHALVPMADGTYVLLATVTPEEADPYWGYARAAAHVQTLSPTGKPIDPPFEGFGGYVAEQAAVTDTGTFFRMSAASPDQNLAVRLIPHDGAPATAESWPLAPRGGIDRDYLPVATNSAGLPYVLSYAGKKLRLEKANQPAEDFDNPVGSEPDDLAVSPDGRVFVHFGKKTDGETDRFIELVSGKPIPSEINAPNGVVFEHLLRAFLRNGLEYAGRGPLTFSVFPTPRKRGESSCVVAKSISPFVTTKVGWTRDGYLAIFDDLRGGERRIFATRITCNNT